MIKFGTGGWRAIIADEFTKANLQLLVSGLCRMMQDEEKTGQGVMVFGPGTLTVSLTKTGNDIAVTVTKAVPTLTPIAGLFTEEDTFLLSARTTMKV